MNIVLDLQDWSMLSILIPISLALIYFKSLDAPLRVLILLLLVSGITDIINAYLYSKTISNMGVMNVYTLLELGLYSIYYTINLADYRGVKHISRSLVLIFVLTIFFTVTSDFNEKINTITLTIESLTIIFMSLIYFDKMLKSMRLPKIWQDPYFWINSAILIYFSGSFFVFIFVDFVDIKSSFNLWHIHSIVHFIFNIVLTVGFWKAQKEQI